MASATTTAWGADVEAMRTLSKDLNAWSGELIDVLSKLNGSLQRLDWFGPDADRFRREQNAHQTGPHADLIRAIQRAEELLIQNAQAQENVSRSVPSPTGLGHDGRRVTTQDDLSRVRSASDVVNNLLRDDFRGVTHGDLIGIQRTLTDLRPTERDRLIAALSRDQLEKLRREIGQDKQHGGLSEEERRKFYVEVTSGVSGESVRRLLGGEIGQKYPQAQVQTGTDGNAFMAQQLRAMDENQTPPDKIRVVALDDGSYVVSLPGVIDLKAGAVHGLINSGISPLGGALTALSEWNAGNSAHSARDMRWASAAATGSDNGSLDGENPYKQDVQWALQSAGVPSGAKVKLVGHSFGGYTAAQLAADPRFNSIGTGGRSADGSYSVQVTHLLTAGADTDWIASRVSPNTKTLIINSRQDVPYSAEAALQLNGSTKEVLFDGGISTDLGHHPNRYANYLESDEARKDPRVQEFFGSPQRATSGQAYLLTAKDHYRPR
jgi:hypothetical protein